MTDEKTAQPTLGTWAKLPSEEIERKPKIVFEINIPKKVTFKSNEPKEYQGDTGAYYVFEVEEVSNIAGKSPEAKVIMTSAWSLLRALKIHSPLQGKNLEITKKLEKGKQMFIVKAY